MTSPGQTAAMGVNEAVPEWPTESAPFGRALVEAGRANARIVGLTADLGKYTDIHPFRDAFPERFFQIGMAEQNLIGVSAGLARTGFVPYCTTYAVFATRRAYDFIAIGCAVGRANVKIVAGLPGLTTGYGATHQGIEDLALMRSIPGLAVLDPCDATELAQAVHAMAAWDGPCYMRLQRGEVPRVFDPATHPFRIGNAQRVREGADVGIIATGLMTGRALQAHALLESQGIRATVLHVPTLKPFDAEAVATLAATGLPLVTAENHKVQGGLATAVAEALVAHRLANRLVPVGLPDQFIECGSVPYLQAKYGLTAGHVAEAARQALEAAS